MGKKGKESSGADVKSSGAAVPSVPVAEAPVLVDAVDAPFVPASVEQWMVLWFSDGEEHGAWRMPGESVEDFLYRLHAEGVLPARFAGNRQYYHVSSDVQPRAHEFCCKSG